MVQTSLHETAMSVQADDGLKIAGTLTLPPEPGPHPAAALLMPGKLDRNGNTRTASLELGRALAASLVARGVASYRFDRRGVGETRADWMRTGFFEHRNDAAAVLRALVAYPAISTVAAIGYSEGALHAIWLGAYASPPCSAVVLLGCPAQKGDDFYRTWASRLRREHAPWWFRLAMRPLGRTPVEQVARVIDKLKKTRGDIARIYGFKVPARMCREYLNYDPRSDMARIVVPVLAITGSNDFSVDHHDLDVIADLVPGPVETRCLPDLTHVMRRDPRPTSANTYREQYKLPVDKELLEIVADWIARQLQPGPR